MSIVSLVDCKSWNQQAQIPIIIDFHGILDS